MGILRRLSDELDIHLPVDALIGRGDLYDVSLQHRKASRPHAILHWSSDHWVLRDLGSANGTYVGNVLLKPGSSKVLRRGVIVSFGTPDESYQMMDTSSPTPLARQLSSGRTIPMRDGLLQLPDDSGPRVSVYEGRDASSLSIDMAPRLGRAVDREVIDLDGDLWQLRTATVASTSTTYATMPLCVGTMSIAFDADPAWTCITLQLADGDQTVDVRHYAHHELLLILAKERVADVALGKDIGECGWLSVGEVGKRLGASDAVVNSLVHKVRSGFKKHNVVPAADAIERRPGRLRIGIAHIGFAGAAMPSSP